MAKLPHDINTPLLRLYTAPQHIGNPKPVHTYIPTHTATMGNQPSALLDSIASGSNCTSTAANAEQRVPTLVPAPWG
jgi:hypothetical protein